ncbi:conserved Plasmodium protein, unknown function [Plasmodium vinckei]|uniref:SNARE protein n=1 Tax=Plasmodium vinckei TaxID=5860 RepID=A0A6V7TCF6_PLAVN|nr:conserved Plasmodium protein, unknown function [Plasmodium vinckei]
MNKNLLLQFFECRIKKKNLLYRQKFFFFSLKRENNDSVNFIYNVIPSNKNTYCKENGRYIIGKGGKIIVPHFMCYSNLGIANDRTSDVHNGNNESKNFKNKDDHINKELGEINSLENILDETNSTIYINDICFQMDKMILKCQTYEDILSILVTHRGALFLQNLITAIRMLSGFVIEDKKKKKMEEELRMSSIKYSEYVDAKDNNNKSNDTIHLDNSKGVVFENSQTNDKYNEKENNIYANNQIDNGNSISPLNDETGIDIIERNALEKYKSIFETLNNKELVKSENKFEKQRNIEEIIVLDERFNLLIDDIYKNRKHFDVISICHILISLKELNYKHFLLFNCFNSPLKKFDIYIKEQFENNQKNISHINLVIHLLLKCFDAYIWAGYYNLDIYNKLINSILLNDFIYVNHKFLQEQHYDKIKKYTFMNYTYDINYPININEVLKTFNLRSDLTEIHNFNSNFCSSKNSSIEPCEAEENIDKKEIINGYETKDTVNFSHKQINKINGQIIEGENENEIIKDENYINTITPIKNIDNINDNGWFCCPIFLNPELFLKSMEICKNIYAYNPDFFIKSEKIVYYYTQYLSPSNLSLIADAFSKHKVFSLEHDRLFFHISKILENNFDKFSYEDIFIILRSFKKVNLCFKNSIILSAQLFKEYFDYLYINRKECILSLKDISILIEALSFFDFHHENIDNCIISSLKYIEDYIDEIDEETSINISYSLVLSNLINANTYLFSFLWRKIGKTTFWEKRKQQICLLWLSHMIQFKWMDYDLPKFCVLESLKMFFLKRKEKNYSFFKIISYISNILNQFNIQHDVFVDIYGPYILDILIKNKKQVIMLTQDTTRNDINMQLGDSKIIFNHLKLYGYNVRSINIKYFDSLNENQKKDYIKDVVSCF